MNRTRLYAGILSLAAMAITAVASRAQAPAAPAHTAVTMTLTIKANADRTAQLFTPAGMQCWLGQHGTQFLYTQAANDAAGSVFTMEQGPEKSVWVNTMLDLKAGKAQYAMFIPGAAVTVVDVTLHPDGDTTRVDLTHTVTALSADAHNAPHLPDHAAAQQHIAMMQQAVEACLAH